MYVRIKKEYPSLRGLKVKEIRTLSMIENIEAETSEAYEKYFVNLVMHCCNFDTMGNRDLVAQLIAANHRFFFDTIHQLTFGYPYTEHVDNDNPFIDYIKIYSKVNTLELLDNTCILITKTGNSIHDISEMLYSDFIFYISKLRGLLS